MCNIVILKMCFCALKAWRLQRKYDQFNFHILICTQTVKKMYSLDTRICQMHNCNCAFPNAALQCLS